MRRCYCCREMKPESDFYLKKSGPRAGNYGCLCKSCGRVKSLASYYQNLEHRRKVQAEYALKHRQELSRKALEKYHSDKVTNLRVRIMSRLSQSIKTKGAKRNKWMDVFGYTVNDLRKHLERRFADGMSWDNYGEWHIDHVIPIAAFNFSSPEDIDFKKCWSLKNLRPMWAKSNLRKSARLEKPFQPSLTIAVN